MLKRFSAWRRGAKTPENPGDYEYPFRGVANSALYKRHRERNGRSANDWKKHRHYDLDQAMGRAMMLVRKILAYG